MDIQALRTWIGKESVHTEIISEQACARIAGTLGNESPPVTGDVLPLPWHWLFCLPESHSRNIGVDGHPERGGFLPPVPLPRRMWAASQVEIHDPIRVGEAVTFKSRVTDVIEKQGRSGTLIFVTVKHEVHRTEVHHTKWPVLTDVQTIVYRERPTGNWTAPQAPEAASDAQWSRVVVPDRVLLFRYSALMFNAHRIHYDRDYATVEEGYPGLVVQGPLIASLLLDLLQEKRSDLQIRSFQFRAINPLFDLSPFSICARVEGDVAQLWAENEEGVLAATIEATVKS